LGACGRPAAKSGHTRNGLMEEGEPELYLHLPGRGRLEIININIQTDKTTDSMIDLQHYHPVLLQRRRLSLEG